MFEAMPESIRRYKRKKTSSKNTFDVLRPIKFLSHITGFRGFEYPRGHSRPKLSFIYALTVATIYYIGWYYEGYIVKVREQFHFQETLYQITGIMNQIGMVVIYVVGCYQNKSMKLSVRRIHEVDVTLQELGSPGNFNIIYNKMVAIVTIVFLEFCFFIVLHIIVHLFATSRSYKTISLVFSVFIQFYGQIVEYILIMEFFVVVSCIGSEFQRANDLLGDINVLPFSSIAMELLDYKNSKNSFLRNKSLGKTPLKLFTILPSSQRLRSHLQMTSHEIIRTRRLLQTIRQVHLELYRVSKRISMIYGMQTAIEISLCISYMTYFIYSFCSTYHTANSIWLMISIVGTSILCINNSIKIFSINYVCEKTSQEAQRTGEIIYTFFGQSTDSELRQEVEMFCLQMMHCRLVYSAAGLYSLNYKTICGCVGVITTYVVIMIQVTNSLEEELS